jgi:predicted nucleotidyltransferase
VRARELLNEYDLGLPVPIASLEERRRAVPTDVWARLERVKEALVALLGPRLQEVRLFGSYARNQFDDESDVDVLILVEGLQPGERQRVVDAVLELTGWGVILAPLVLTVAQFDALRAREKLIAQDIDREGITV